MSAKKQTRTLADMTMDDLLQLKIMVEVAITDKNKELIDGADGNVLLTMGNTEVEFLITKASFALLMKSDEVIVSGDGTIEYMTEDGTYQDLSLIAINRINKTADDVAYYSAGGIIDIATHFRSGKRFMRKIIY